MMRRLVLAAGLAAMLVTVLAVGSATALMIAPPVPVTGSATAVTTTTATLNGTVNPVGSATDYSFQYGTTTAYGQTTPAQSAGSGLVAANVASPVTGLTPGTTYHFRLVATPTAGGTAVDGSDQTFTTNGPPVVRTGAATAVAPTAATLNGTVNPAGQATTYSFQYGPTTGYGQQTPTQSAAGTADVPVSATIAGLTPGTTYHYRLTATNASGPVPGADQTFVTVGTRAASTLAVTVKPAGGDTDLGLNLSVGTDPSGTPGQALAIGEAISSQFVNQLAAFGACPAAAFNNLQGPTAANCADRSAIVGAGTLVVRNQAGADVTSDQGFLVKTAPNVIVFWWHTPAPTVGGAQGFGQVAGLVSQETGAYGPVVTYDFSGLPAGSRVKRLNLTYQRNPVTGKAPFAATACTGASQAFQARIVYLGGVPSELPATTVACALAPAPQPSKLALARATITGRVIDILAPISRRASGNVSLDLYSAGQHARWTAAINSVDGRIRDTHVLPASMANNGGTGILTIRYAGNAVTRPQVVRLRAGSVPAVLDAARPTLDAAGHLHAQGTISSQAHGVVRVQLEYYSGGQTTTLERFATVSGGAWRLDATLTAAQQAAVVARQGPVESYILFTGYFPRRMRGEMIAYQVLGAR